MMVKNFLILLMIGSMTSCALHTGNEEDSLPQGNPESVAEFKDILSSDYSVPPPPISDLFPCSQCHADMEVNTQRRVLVDMHDDIVFDHDSENRWCLACHDPQERDSLRLASGKRIPFTESYLLCGQCHGPKFRDWKMGIHGKRTGEWNGKKQYLLCVHCHDQHSPRIKPIAPMPAPRKPTDLLIDSTKLDENEK